MKRDQQALTMYLGMRPSANTIRNSSVRRCHVRVYRSGNSYYEDLFLLSDTRKPEVSVEWGYCGTGPGDLALSLLADVVSIPEALQNDVAFVHDFISKFPRDVNCDCEDEFVNEWILTGAAILEWLAARDND